jgi:hypothetical protein
VIGDAPRDGRPRDRDAKIVRDLHAAIRHGRTRSGASDATRANELVDRAICVIDELARATRITVKVWTDALASVVAAGPTRSPRRTS